MPEGQPVVAPPMHTLDQKVLDQILDPSFVIERFRRNLLGLIQVKEDGKFKWLRLGEPIMSEDGVRQVVSLIDRYINRNTLLSNLTEEEVYEIMRNFSKTLTKWLDNNKDLYGIERKDINIIKTSIVDMVFFALKQAQNKELLKAITQAYSVSEYRDEGVQKRGGLAARIGGALGLGGGGK